MSILLTPRQAGTSAAAVIAPIRHGHKVTRRRPLKVALSSKFPRSASAQVAEWPGGRAAGWSGGRVAEWPSGRVAECRALTVRCSAVSTVPRTFLIGQVSRVFSPS
jgi:hypothetical protein